MFLRIFLLGYVACMMTIAAVGMFAKAFSQQWVTVNLASKHLMDGKYNEFNPGLGIEYHVPETDYAVVTGFFNNSKSNLAAYVGGSYSPLKLDLGVAQASLGVMGAMFWGYGSTPVPAVALIGSLERNSYGLNLLWFPPKHEGNGVLGLQIRWKLD